MEEALISDKLMEGRQGVIDILGMAIEMPGRNRWESPPNRERRHSNSLTEQREVGNKLQTRTQYLQREK